MCEYCRQDERDNIVGETIFTDEFIKTRGYNPEELYIAVKGWCRKEAFEMLELFILKGKNDEKAGLFVNTISGARYIDINYCPMCGRNLVEKVEE